MTTDRLPAQRLGDAACSVAARARHDPLVGSAPPARGWLVFEHPGPWPRTATAVFGRLGQQMADRCLAVEVRPMLVRRPGRATGTSPRRWWFVDSLARTSVTGTWESDDDVAAVLDLVDVRRLDAAARMVPAEPMILVCTHAKHDVCCAVRGRPIAATLSTRWPESVWEASHLGGDRFAGNVTMLPDSTFYGRLEPATAEHVVADHLAGVTTLEHYRGAGVHTPAEQAAVAEVLRRSGSPRHDDISVAGAQPIGRDVWEVVLVGRGEVPAHTVVTVRRHWREPHLLTCSGLQLKRAAEFEAQVVAV